MYIYCIFIVKTIKQRCRRGRDRIVVGFTTTNDVPMQLVPITTDVVSSNLDQVEIYNIM